MTFRKFITVALILCASMSSFAQNQQTIEELYLQTTIETQVIASQASADTQFMKEMAIYGIEDMLVGGRLTEDNEEIVEVLDSLAREGITNRVIENGRVVNNYTTIRQKAVNILGRVGGVVATNTLIDVLDTDTEPMVLSEAVFALGNIDQQSYDEVLSVISDVVRSQTVITTDNNFAFVSINAIEKIAEKNNGISDPEIFTALIEIVEGNYNHAVRSRALDLLTNLREYR